MEWAVIIAVLLIWGAISNHREKQNQSQVRNEILNAIGDGLAVSCRFEDVSDEDTPAQDFVAHASVSGSILVPRDNFPVEWVVRITDVTNGEDDEMPIFCSLPDFADEESMYEVTIDTHIPYRFSEISDAEIAPIPLFALRGPKKGERQWRVHVLLRDKHKDNEIISYGSQQFRYHQSQVGYTEWKEHSLQQEECIASLALAMAATDGRISKRETAIINKFFKDRYFNMDDPSDRKERVSQSLQLTMARLQGGTNSRQLIDQCCKQITSMDDIDLVHAGYELCAKVATADNKLDPQEEFALDYISQKLNINHDFIKEVKAREIRVHMYGGQASSLERQLQMPANQTTPQKLQWLQNEYATWQPRQSNADPEIATEATLRIDLIMKLTTELESKVNDEITF